MCSSQIGRAGSLRILGLIGGVHAIGLWFGPVRVLPNSWLPAVPGWSEQVSVLSNTCLPRGVNVVLVFGSLVFFGSVIFLG